MNPTRHLLAAAAALLLSLPAALTGQAQAAETRASVRAVPASSAAPAVLNANKLTGPEPVIDGKLEDPAWANVPAAEGFTQFEPAEGNPATERTTAKVVYGADALFVAIRAYDSDPKAIAGQLTRRDQDSYSDEVSVIVDSYFDRRTAFQFMVNPVGVKTDNYLFNDTNQDRNWDAVWDVATSIDTEGWTAEFRIPYSQLRFKAGSDTWGINFTRVIARRQETDAWAPTRKSESAVVSRFGELRGMKSLTPPRHLEVVPYTLGKMDRKPADVGNPFWKSSALSSAAGADVKYGVSSNLTLDLTLNPDFGQVEADPSQVNLSAFESFFSERRPFFVEGSNLYTFGLGFGDGDNSSEGLFYSRRIGRTPQGSADAGDNGFTKTPDNTRILTAAKLSGKTGGGWSIGLLDAVTARENAQLAPAIGPRSESPVEPLTDYTVARVSKDFRNGKSAVGAIGTLMQRDPTVADELDLRRRAVSGGVDTRSRFDNDKWEVVGFALATRVEGSDSAIAETQRSSARYFQRPDNDHVTYDPTRTSLTGESFGVSLSKVAGGHIRGSATLTTRSPGFEPNDAGFMRSTDAINSGLWVSYVQNSPQGIFRRWQLNVNAGDVWSFGGENFGPGGNVNGNFQLKNFWGGYGGFAYNGVGLATDLLRGGPAYKKEPNWNGWYGFNSDTRKPIKFFFNGNWNYRSASRSFNYSFNPEVDWRPSGRVQMSVSPNYSRTIEDVQWVDRIGDAPNAAYVFGRMDQGTLGVTTRFDVAFTPTLTLQLYGQPFTSGGSYTGFKKMTSPRADRYADRFTPINARLVGDTYYADVTPSPGEESFGRPDFNFREFHSNAVLRWEYRPGSALFLVWAQGRDNSDLDAGHFKFGDDMRTLFSTAPRNIFMVKLSYWLNP